MIKDISVTRVEKQNFEGDITRFEIADENTFNQGAADPSTLYLFTGYGETTNYNTLSFYHSPSSSLKGNLFYFTNLQLDVSLNRQNRAVTVMNQGVAKKAAWSAYCTATGSAANTNYTGYFINNTKNITGVINSSIRVSASNSLFNYTGTIDPEITVDAGDLVSIGFGAPNAITAPSNFQNSVDIYFYK